MTMQFDILSVFLVLIADAIAGFFIYVIGKNFETKLVSIIALICFNISSCIGIILNEENNSYVLSAMVFIVAMVVFVCVIMEGNFVITVSRYRHGILGLSQYEKSTKSISILGILCLVIVVISTFYPNNYLTQLTQASFSVTGQRFALRIARSSGLAWVIDRIKLVLLPFFFIWLFTLRDNWKAFIGAFMVYSICDMLQNALLTSRSHYLQIIVFILIYLTLEKKITKKQLLVISILLGTVGIILMVWFKDLIMGKNYTYTGFGDYFQAFLTSEYSGGQARLEYCNSVNNELSFFHYLYHCFTAPLFFLPDDGFPTLSYYFTTGVLGLNYGQVGYYVILPGAFGEGVMVLGKHLAWIYGMFIGLYAGFFFKFLRKYDYLRYVYVYFIIQFGLAFRGGIQAFVMRSLNCIVYFLIIMFFMRVVQRDISDRVLTFRTQD